jgi:integrase
MACKRSAVRSRLPPPLHGPQTVTEVRKALRNQGFIFFYSNNRTGGLPAPHARHYAAISDPQQLGQLLRDIRAYKGNLVTRAALQLAPLVFQRPGQLRLAHWEDVDLESAIWRCPPEKMKIRQWKKRDSRTPAHLVPLPVQAVEILRELHPLTGPKGPIFRSMAKRSAFTRYMSDNTLNSALRTLGYDTKEQITTHGFRATARTDSRISRVGQRGN